MKEKRTRYRPVVDPESTLVIDAIPVALIFVSEKNGHVLFANTRFAEIFGFSANKSKSESLPKLLCDDSDQENMRLGTWTSSKQETRAVDKNGDKIWINVSQQRLMFGSEPAVLSVIEEISGRKSAERAVKQLITQNELILASAGEGIYGLDCDGNTTFANPAAAEILGWERDELLGKPQHMLIHHSHKDGSAYPREDCPIYAAFNDGKVHTVDSEVFWRKDGTCLPVEYTSTPIRNDVGELAGAVVTFRDISARKKAESDLKTALDEVSKLKDQLQAENTYLQEEIKLSHNFDEIIGSSKSFRRVLSNVEKVATTDATVLILGETGTGKELIARAVHRLSPRKDRPLVKVNCAALPGELIESELFGHEKGAFTNAVAQRSGRFELADGGTVFLDEIGDLPHEQQAKLLRVLQEGEFERVGGSRTLSVDVRVIAATNANLPERVESGEFREDLYYRLNVFPLIIPPLRERPEDISSLAQHFVDKYAKKMGREIKSIPAAVISTLQSYRYQGNVRELENIIERAVILAADGVIRLDDRFQRRSTTIEKGRGGETLADVQRNHIHSVLDETSWQIEGENGAAVRLGVKASTLRSRMKKLGIEKPK